MGEVIPPNIATGYTRVLTAEMNRGGGDGGGAGGRECSAESGRCDYDIRVCCEPAAGRDSRSAVQTFYAIWTYRQRQGGDVR